LIWVTARTSLGTTGVDCRLGVNKGIVRSHACSKQQPTAVL